MRHSKKHQAFINSEYFKEARMRGLRNAWAKQANGPKCGAKRRSDGEPHEMTPEQLGREIRKLERSMRTAASGADGDGVFS
ncbi:hypothetical protein CLV75_2542 [Ruegeria conchae]|uniref:Uncharacterized protein n=1 Tax=Ruegeria conchae TaxID=981384 RepID=A0A497ZFC4_9RHOB|nr:hypothetical protein CLV75_2542 [Ruegeria conchae]